MAWINIPAGSKIKKVRFHEKKRALDVVFRDGRTARAEGIVSERFEEFLQFPTLDKDTYFHNLIDPYVTKRTSSRPGYSAALKKTIAALGIALLIYVIFSLIQLAPGV